VNFGDFVPVRVVPSVVAITHGCYDNLLGWQLIVDIMSLLRNSTSDFVFSGEFGFWSWFMHLDKLGYHKFPPVAHYPTIGRFVGALQFVLYVCIIYLVLVRLYLPLLCVQVYNNE